MINSQVEYVSDSDDDDDDDYDDSSSDDDHDRDLASVKEMYEGVKAFIRDECVPMATYVHNLLTATQRIDFLTTRCDELSAQVRLLMKDLEDREAKAKRDSLPAVGANN